MNKELIKQAFQAGYAQGLKKQAELSEEEFNELRKLQGFGESSPALYKAYKKQKKLVKILLPLLFGAAGGFHGYAIGDSSRNGNPLVGAGIGAGIGGLAGAGIVGLGSATEKNWLKKLRENSAPSAWAL